MNFFGHVPPFVLAPLGVSAAFGPFFLHLPSSLLARCDPPMRLFLDK